MRIGSLVGGRGPVGADLGEPAAVLGVAEPPAQRGHAVVGERAQPGRPSRCPSAYTCVIRQVIQSSSGRSSSGRAGVVQPGEAAIGVTRGAAEREEPVALGLEPAHVRRVAQPEQTLSALSRRSRPRASPLHWCSSAAAGRPVHAPPAPLDRGLQHCHPRRGAMRPVGEGRGLRAPLRSGRGLPERRTDQVSELVGRGGPWCSIARVGWPISWKTWRSRFPSVEGLGGGIGMVVLSVCRRAASRAPRASSSAVSGWRCSPATGPRP